MNRSILAVLLSTLVFPGVGHLYLKQFPRGLALIVVGAASLWFIIVRAMQQASAAFSALESGGSTLEAARMAEAAAQSSGGAGSGIATLVFVVCWVVGMVDAYRLGKK